MGAIFMKRFHILFSISCALLFSASSAIGSEHSSSSKQSVSAALPVQVAKVQLKDVPKMIASLGTLEAFKRVILSSEVAGRVLAINFKDGQQVGKDMPVVQLNNAQAKADYQSAVTDFQLAKQKYDRSKSLVNIAISKQDLSVLEADVATKKAAVQSKLADLNEKQVTAPFSGTLGAFKAQVGAYVTAGQALVSLVKTQQLKVEYNLPEKVMTELDTGQLVRVKTSAYPKQYFYGTVTFISPTVNSSSRMVELKALIDNKNGVLRPGMFVHIEQQVSTVKNALVVPAAAISADIKGYYVFRLDKQRVSKVYVKIGMQMGANTQIVSGLKASDVVVVAGQQKLSDGSLVKVTGNGS
jgi:membrane fusion protein (multidrug efflux system)